jgi:hypothetical protein
MNINGDSIFKLLNVVSWIIFVGLAIETGGYFTNGIVTLFFNSEWATHYWGNLDLSGLYNFDFGLFICFIIGLITISLFKTILFYHTISIFHKKKFNLENPFNDTIKIYIFNFSYIALGIGLLSYSMKVFSNWLINQEVHLPSIENMNIGGSDVWIFMGITLLLFAKIFKKGVELQNENDFTV